MKITFLILGVHRSEVPPMGRLLLVTLLLSVIYLVYRTHVNYIPRACVVVSGDNSLLVFVSFGSPKYRRNGNVSFFNFWDGFTHVL